MANQVYREGNTIQEVAAAEITVGTFAFTSTGLAKFYGHKGQDSQPVQAGALASPYSANITIRVEKASATDVYAVGDPVFGNATTQKAVLTAGDGALGYAAEASASGDEYVAVVLNGSKYGQVAPESYAASDIADNSHEINTDGKFAGKLVWDSTNNQPVWAAGSGASDVWVDGGGTTVHTPN